MTLISMPCPHYSVFHQKRIKQKLHFRFIDFSIDRSTLDDDTNRPRWVREWHLNYLQLKNCLIYLLNVRSVIVALLCGILSFAYFLYLWYWEHSFRIDSEKYIFLNMFYLKIVSKTSTRLYKDSISNISFIKTWRLYSSNK